MNEHIEDYDIDREERLLAADENIIIAAEDIRKGDAVIIQDGKYFKARPIIQKVPLDLDNYHSLANRYLTNSRIGDWLKDKKYFKERHITGERPNGADTDPLRIGKGVDTIVFFGEEEFCKKFIVPEGKRNLKNPPAGITELTQQQFDDCLTMGRLMRSQPFFAELSDFETQKIIKIDMDLGKHFCGLAAIPDWIRVKDGVCDIVDLKTAVDASERKYFYKCLDFGYFRQMAVMKMIMSELDPSIKEFNYWHFVCEKNNDGIFLPYVYRLAPERINALDTLILEDLLPKIKAEKEFKSIEARREDASWIGEVEDY